MPAPAATGMAAKVRAKLSHYHVKLPVRADAENAGVILTADGQVVLGIAVKRLGLNDPRDALPLAELVAAAINWYSGMDVK